jgi:ribosomal protein L11 methyltransferase
LRLKLEAYLAPLQLPAASLIALEEEQFPEEDWLQKWKEGYHPLFVGDRFIVSPSWEKPEDPGDRFIIEIDPGMAFGTGTHATTQLCLVAMEPHWRGGRFLDIGTGTGILAIAAAKLHPDARIVAVDNDPIAIDVAGENLAHNRMEGRIELLAGSVEDLSGQRFDLVVANLTAEIIEAHIVPMAGLLADGGTLILSGVLSEQEALLRSRLSQVGLRVTDRLAADEWVALVASP